MKHYFLTGTDTDCGKTYVLSELLNYLNQKHKAQALKPLASGCEEIDNQLISQDIVRLQKCNANPNLNINRWKYLPPISPHLAAQLAGDAVDVTQIMQFCQQDVFFAFDYLLIEGAGGLLVPLNSQETWLDFLKLTAMPVILVVGLRLGCINHALLSDTVLKINQIPCLGWIANYISEDMLFIEENIATLEAKMHMPLIGRVYYKQSSRKSEFKNSVF